MKFTFLLLTLVMVIHSPAQHLGDPHIQVRKNGKVKKRLFTGTEVIIQDTLGREMYGGLSIISDSIVFIGRSRIGVGSIESIRLKKQGKRFGISKETALWTALGFVISTAGMTASGYEDLKSAAINSTVIIGLPISLAYLKTRDFKKKQFKGKKYSFRVWMVPHAQGGNL